MRQLVHLMGLDSCYWSVSSAMHKSNLLRTVSKTFDDYRRLPHDFSLCFAYITGFRHDVWRIFNFIWLSTRTICTTLAPLLPKSAGFSDVTGNFAFYSACLLQTDGIGHRCVTNDAQLCCLTDIGCHLKPNPSRTFLTFTAKFMAMCPSTSSSLAIAKFVFSVTKLRKQKVGWNGKKLLTKR